MTQMAQHDHHVDLVPAETTAQALPLVRRAKGGPTPFNPGDAMAAVAEMLAIPLPPKWRGQLARQAEALLKAHFAPDVVCAALLAAVRRGRPTLAQDIAGEMMIAKAGMRQSYRQFQAELDRFAASTDPRTGHIYRALRGEAA